MNNLTIIYNRLKSSANRMTKNSYDGDELLHFTIEYAIEHSMHRIDELSPDELFSYLNRAMWLGWNSKTSAYRQLYKLDTVELNSELISENYSFLNDRVKLENVDIALSRLPDHERILFEAYLEDSFNYKEWADIAGVSVEYMYKYINYIKSKIKKYVVRTSKGH